MEEYVPFLHDSAHVLQNAGLWADQPDESLSVIMDREMWNGDFLFPRMICLKDNGIEIDSNGKPVNPYRNNSAIGRGKLGKWGPNHAADLVVTTDFESGIFVLVVFRSELEQMIPALPGGMIEIQKTTGLLESSTHTAERELFEEAIDLETTDPEAVNKLKKLIRESKMLYCGVVKGEPRNTKNAWIETCVLHVHLPTELAKKLKLLENGDKEGETKGTIWMKLTDDNIESMYNDGHKSYVRMAMARNDLSTFVFFTSISIAAIVIWTAFVVKFLSL